MAGAFGWCENGGCNHFGLLYDCPEGELKRYSTNRIDSLQGERMLRFIKAMRREGARA